MSQLDSMIVNGRPLHVEMGGTWQARSEYLARFFTHNWNLKLDPKTRQWEVLFYLLCKIDFSVLKCTGRLIVTASLPQVCAALKMGRSCASWSIQRLIKLGMIERKTPGGFMKGGGVSAAASELVWPPPLPQTPTRESELIEKLLGQKVVDERAPSEGAERAPSEGAERAPSEGAERAPSEGAERAPSEGAERAPSEGAERAPSEGAERAPSEGALLLNLQRDAEIKKTRQTKQIKPEGEGGVCLLDRGRMSENELAVLNFLTCQDDLFPKLPEASAWRVMHPDPSSSPRHPERPPINPNRHAIPVGWWRRCWTEVRTEINVRGPYALLGYKLDRGIEPIRVPFGDPCTLLPNIHQRREAVAKEAARLARAELENDSRFALLDGVLDANEAAALLKVPGATEGQIKIALRCLAESGKKVESPGGFLRRAIEEHWAPPMTADEHALAKLPEQEQERIAGDRQRHEAAQGQSRRECGVIEGLDESTLARLIRDAANAAVPMLGDLWRRVRPAELRDPDKWGSLRSEVVKRIGAPS